MVEYKNWKKSDAKLRETNTELWKSDWYSSDGDTVQLFFKERPNNLIFDLYCFSGIPASFIRVDDVDFGALLLYITLKEDKKYTTKELALEVADYLCGLFCEKL